MGIKEFAEREQVKNFFEMLIQRHYENCPPETREAVEECFYDIFKTAESMNKDDADTYLTACLAVYIMEHFIAGGDNITRITPTS
jgi:hypothetical protein